MQVVRFLATTTVTSLLDQDEDAWRAQIGRPAPKDCTPRALLIYARRKVEDLADAGGWEAEYPRDVWQLRRLGFPGHQTLDFDGHSRSPGCGTWSNGGSAGGSAPAWDWRPPAAGCVP